MFRRKSESSWVDCETEVCSITYVVEQVTLILWTVAYWFLVVCYKQILWEWKEIHRKYLWYFKMFHIKYYFVILHELVWFNRHLYICAFCVCVCVCVYTHTPPTWPWFMRIFNYLWDIFLQCCVCVVCVYGTGQQSFADTFIFPDPHWVSHWITDQLEESVPHGRWLFTPVTYQSSFPVFWQVVLTHNGW